MKKYKLISNLLFGIPLLFLISCNKGNNSKELSVDNSVLKEYNFKYDSVNLNLYEPQKELYSILDSVISESYVDDEIISPKKLVYLFDVTKGYEEDLSITHTEICGLDMSYIKACFIFKNNVFLYTGQFDSNLVCNKNNTLNYKYIICNEKYDISRSWSYKYINNKLILTMVNYDIPNEFDYEFRKWSNYPY
ncbi:MAG: hypothetical protein ACK5M0_05505 [Bacteroidales bacterium]